MESEEKEAELQPTAPFPDPQQTTEALPENLEEPNEESDAGLKEEMTAFQTEIVSALEVTPINQEQNELEPEGLLPPTVDRDATELTAEESNIHVTFSTLDVTESRTITSQEDAESFPSQTDRLEVEKVAGIASADEMQSSEGEEIASEDETKDKKKGGASLANVNQFLKSKREDEGVSASEGEDSEAEKAKKKKGGALGHVSRFLGKAVKKEKEKEPDIFKDLGLIVSQKRDSDEMSYSEEREEIPSEVLHSVAITKLEIQKIRELIQCLSKSLDKRPRIVTYLTVEESKELKQRIVNLVQKVPEGIPLNHLESDESKTKCKQILQVIGQELDAMNLLAETIHTKLSQRRI